ncbi:TrmH family RNA methyltransferase [Candidatus Margulisiibacteriota bacterium]
MLINSLNNPKIKFVRNYLKSNAYRKKAKVFVLETLKPILDICQNKPELIEYILCNENTRVEFPDSINKNKILKINSKIFDKLTTLKAHQGIVAVAKNEEIVFSDVINKAKNIVLLEGIQNPSNFGAVVRSAIAFNIDAVFYTGNYVNPHHPESIRAMAGNVFQIPLVKLEQKEVIELTKMEYQLYSFVPDTGVDLKKIKFGKKNVFVFGAEGQGISNKFLLDKSKKVNIKMNSEIESLNIAVSAGIVFHYFNMS